MILEHQSGYATQAATVLAIAPKIGGTAEMLRAWLRQAEVDSYDNAFAETINGLYKAEVIHRRSWKNLETVELATLEWVDWFNNRRLLEPIGIYLLLRRR
jgi:transposase InsO family protein